MNEIMTMRTDLANQFAAAGAKLLDFTMTAGALAAIPETEPQQYVVAGTLESIHAVMPAAETPARRKDDRHPTEPLSWDDVTDRAAEAAQPASTETQVSAKYYDALVKCARLLDNMPCGESMLDTHKFLAEALSRPAATSGDDLPPLPEGEELALGQFRGWGIRYTVEQMQDYARAAVSAATRPTADLPNLSRYEPIYSDDEGSQMAVAANGEWLHIEDVQSLLATKPAAQAVPADLEARQQVAEALGLGRNEQYSYAWPYLIGIIKECAKACDESGASPAAPLSADAAQEQARNDALEAAIDKCERRKHRQFPGTINAVQSCIDAIKALRTPAAGAEGAA